MHSQLSEQGDLTSRTLVHLLRETGKRLFPNQPFSFAGKTQFLIQVQQSFGNRAVFQAGYDVKTAPTNPVFEALLSAESPVSLLTRWFRLERFGHSRNRTRQVESEGDSTTRLTLEHYALDGGAIHPVNDLYVWGLLVGLIERAGATQVCASLCCSNSKPVPLYHSQTVQPASLTQSHRLQLSWKWQNSHPNTDDREIAASSAEAVSKTAPPTHTMQEKVRAQIRTDLLRSWKIGEIASTLAYSVRSLQRQLQQEQTSFRALLLQERIHTAEKLLYRREMSTTEVAFCAGFSDLAHLSREFKKRVEIPPSVFRDLLPP